MVTLWHNMLHYGRAHGVEPVIFALLYLAHHPLFWGTVAWIVARVRRKRPVAVLVVMAVFFWVMPYAYILVFGHGLPGWAYAAAVGFLVMGGLHAGRQIYRRIRADG
jgi:hypothetical protein